MKENDAMSVLERLRRETPELSAREARAARHLMANYPIAGLSTVAEFARQSGVSTATILRLVKRLGFSVYSDFQAALRTHIEETLQSPLVRFGERQEAEQTTDASFFNRYASQVAGQIKQLGEVISDDDFDRAVNLLADPRRDIHLLGGRYSSNIAAYMGDMLAAVRSKIHIVRGQTQCWPQHLLDMGRGSVLLVFDVRRYQSDVIAFADAAAKRGVTVILLTDIWRSPASRSAHNVLAFPVESPSIFDGLTAGMAVVEALIGAVAQKISDPGKKRIETLEDLRMRFSPESGANEG